MPAKTNVQGGTEENFREIFRRINDYASVTAVFGAANTEKEFTHTLSRPPVGWDVIRKNKAATLYSDAAALGTRGVIRLKSDVASVAATLRIF